MLRCFPGPGKRREEFCPKELSQSDDTQEARDKYRNSMRKHTCYEESKERERSHSTGGNQKKLHKGGGKRGHVGGGRKHRVSNECPFREGVRTGPGVSALLIYIWGTQDLRGQQVS